MVRVNWTVLSVSVVRTIFIQLGNISFQLVSCKYFQVGKIIKDHDLHSKPTKWQTTLITTRWSISVGLWCRLTGIPGLYPIISLTTSISHLPSRQLGWWKQNVPLRLSYRTTHRSLIRNNIKGKRRNCPIKTVPVPDATGPSKLSRSKCNCPGPNATVPVQMQLAHQNCPGPLETDPI